MEKEAKHDADFYQIITWAHANRQRLMIIAAAVLLVVAGLGFYNWNKNNRGAYSANEALSKTIQAPSNAEEATNATRAEAYLKVAANYPGTSAGARALLIAGGVYFDTGKYQDARKQFERFMTEYSDHPLTPIRPFGNQCLSMRLRVI